MKKIIFKTILFFIGLGVLGAGFLTIAIMTIYPKLPSMDDLRNYHPKLPLRIYSEDNLLLGQFGDEKRIFMPFDKTPKMLVNAILAAEDSRFYEHGGIDFRGIIRATIGDITSGKLQSGASTITMQVARNFFLSKQKTFSRKFYEVMLAYKIEQSLSKDQILELYINQIYLGQRAYGFAEASITYFGKTIDKLSIAQYAVLAGLPKAPSTYNPIINKSRSHDRELYVLGRMLDAGFINQYQYNEAISENIKTTRGSLNDITNSGGYIAEMVRQMMYDKYGESIYSQGYKVYTTIDSKMQQSGYDALRKGLLQYTMNRGYQGAEKQINLPTENDSSLDDAISNAFDNLVDYGNLKAAIVINCNNNQITAQLRNGSTITINGDSIKTVKKFINTGNEKQITSGSVIRVINLNNNWIISQMPEVEGSIVALNPNNGAIKTMVGGFDFFKNNYNHVTQSMRQPGSGFKPFIYSAALEKGFSANTVINGDPVCFANGSNGQWCPKNDKDNEVGPATFREALARSLNIPTVKIINQITPEFTIDYINKFGFDKKQFQPYLTMSLGANEVTPLQLAQAYAVFANGGYLVNPYIINTITDNDGNILAKTAVPDIAKESPVIDPRNAFIINSILQYAVQYGTGAKVYKAIPRSDLAGKTGTTSDNKDVWFNGYTPNLVAITWVGFDQPKSLGAHAYGTSLAAPIWIDFMKPIMNLIPPVQMQMPTGIAVLESGAWHGGNEYVYANESFLTRLNDNSNNEASATVNDNSNNEASATVNDNSNIDTGNSNDESVTGQHTNAIESLIKGLLD